MKKLVLKIESLRVETFTTTVVREARGTVVGAAATGWCSHIDLTYCSCYPCDWH